VSSLRSWRSPRPDAPPVHSPAPEGIFYFKFEYRNPKNRNKYEIQNPNPETARVGLDHLDFNIRV
jgi:hypothetical protein